MRKERNLTYFGRLAMAGWLIGWSLLACARVTSPATPTPAIKGATPSTAASPDPRQGGTYTNELAGFSMTLPENWNVAGPFAVQGDNLSYQVYTLGVDAGSEGGPGMSRIVIGDASVLTVEGFTQQQCQTCPMNPVEHITLDGRPAQRVLVGGGGVPFMVEWTFVQLGGQLVGFSLHDPETLEPLPSVLESVSLP